jgi:hypothetical protein
MRAADLYEEVIGLMNGDTRADARLEMEFHLRSSISATCA